MFTYPLSSLWIIPKSGRSNLLLQLDKVLTLFYEVKDAPLNGMSILQLSVNDQLSLSSVLLTLINKNSIDKCIWVEWNEIFGLLAKPGKQYR